MSGHVKTMTDSAVARHNRGNEARSEEMRAKCRLRKLIETVSKSLEGLSSGLDGIEDGWTTTNVSDNFSLRRHNGVMAFKRGAMGFIWYPALFVDALRRRKNLIS